jgi:hypothetical protein
MLQSHHIPHLVEQLPLRFAGNGARHYNEIDDSAFLVASQASDRIRRNNSVEYYGEIPSISR